MKAEEGFRTPNALRSHRDLQIHLLDSSELDDAQRLECGSPLPLLLKIVSNMTAFLGHKLGFNIAQRK